jgi:peptidoglycan L-alanyl-D-glutamate endopeptidase CwlK
VKSTTELTLGIRLTASVGRNGENRKPDTRKIQKALNEVYPEPPLKVDGDCGSKAIRRIERLQRGFMARPNGLIDASGRTLKRLNVAVPAMQIDWKGDSSKWDEDKKLASLDSVLRNKTRRILERLKAQGFKPKIFYAWRSVAVQRELVRQGNSTVKFSFHNAQYKNGQPRAYAIDVIDRRWAWEPKAAQNGFWDALGKAGKDEGLFWGGDWTSIKDMAHLQSFPNSKLAEIKRQSGIA